VLRLLGPAVGEVRPARLRAGLQMHLVHCRHRHHRRDFAAGLALVAVVQMGQREAVRTLTAEAAGKTECPLMELLQMPRGVGGAAAAAEGTLWAVESSQQ